MTDRPLTAAEQAEVERVVELVCKWGDRDWQFRGTPMVDNDHPSAEYLEASKARAIAGNEVRAAVTDLLRRLGDAEAERDAARRVLTATEDLAAIVSVLLTPKERPIMAASEWDTLKAHRCPRLTAEDVDGLAAVVDAAWFGDGIDPTLISPMARRITSAVLDAANARLDAKETSRA